MIKKIVTLSILIITVFSLFIVSNSYAIDIDNLIDNPNTTDDGVVELQDASQKLISTIIVAIRIVGTGIATIMLMVLGIKYIMGSVEEKAQIKKHAVVYVVGAVVLFGAMGLLGILQDFIADAVQPL